MMALALAAHLMWSPVQYERTWKSDIQANGWMFRTEDDNAVMFTGPSIATDTSFPQLWIRYELKPGSEYPSYAGLEEFDCEAGSHRKVKITRYPGRNMEGQGTPVAVDRVWEPVPSNGMLKVAFDLVCSRR